MFPNHEMMIILAISITIFVITAERKIKEIIYGFYMILLLKTMIVVEKG